MRHLPLLLEEHLLHGDGGRVRRGEEAAGDVGLDARHEAGGEVHASGVLQARGGSQDLKM